MPNWLTTPLIPEAPVRRAQEYLDTPTLEREPWEARLRGFGAGALEGLRGLSSPAELAGIGAMAIPGAGAAGGIGRGMARASRMAPEALQGLSRALPTIDLLGDVPLARQVLPAADDVSSLIGSMKYNLAKVPQSTPRVPGLGTQVAEFAPQGGEAAYNYGRQLPQAVDPVAQAYSRLLARGGR